MNCEGKRHLTATIRILVSLVAAGFLIGLSSCGDGPTEPPHPGDTTRPTVTATVPAANDSTVSADAFISATFSEPMDAGTMTDDVLLLDPATPGTISYLDLTVLFTPAGALDTNATYTATVSTAARDTAGNSLAAPYSWQFSTFRDTTPPTVINTVPTDGDSTVTVNTFIKAVFSEKMNTTTLGAFSFSIDPAAVGAFDVSDMQMTFIPDQPLDTFQLYTATITSAASDSAGNGLVEDFTWQFYTIRDAVAPTASILWPVDNGVVGDSAGIEVLAADNDRMSRVEFYIDGAHIAQADDDQPPYQYIWYAGAEEIGSEHTIQAVAYDEAGNSAITDSVTVYYLWKPLIADPNEPIARNLKDIFYRRSDIQIQFRVETYNGWGHYTDTAGGLAVALFFDTDQNSATGRRTASGLPLNDIGAEYRITVGTYGDAFDRWNQSDTVWVNEGTPENLLAPDDSNCFEVSLTTARMGDPAVFDLVVAFINSDSFPVLIWDFAPDEGHATVTPDLNYYGSPPAGSRGSGSATASAVARQTPFD